MCYWYLLAITPILIHAPGPDPGAVLLEARLTVDGESVDSSNIFDLGKAQSAIAQLLAAIGAEEDALQTIHAIKYDDVKIACLVKVGRTFADRGRKGAAEKLFEAGKRTILETRSPRSSAFFLTELAAAQFASGDRASAKATIQEALRVASALPDSTSFRQMAGNKPLALYHVAKVLDDLNDTAAADAARQSANDLVRASRDRFDQVMTLQMMMEEWGQTADAQRCLTLLGLFPDDQSREGARWTIALRQARALDPKAAYAILEKNKSEDGKFNMIMQICKLGLYKDSFERASRAIAQLPVARRTSAFVELAAVQREAGKLTDARSTLGQGLRLVPRNDAPALAWFARQYAELGDDLSATLARQAAEEAQHLVDPAQKAGTMRNLAGAYALMGRTEKAATFSDQIPDPFSLKIDALKDIILAQVRTNDVPGALKTLQSLPDRRDRARETGEIAEAGATLLMSQGKTSAALEWARGQTLPLAKARALIGIAQKLSKPSAPIRP